MEPNGTVWQPTRRQQALIDRLASYPYPTLARAAREAGLSESTAKKWHMQPAFRRALQQSYAAGQAEVKEELGQRMRALAEASTTALSAGLEDDDAGVRIRAAQAVLDRLLGKPTQPHLIEVQAEVESFQQTVLDAIDEVAPDVRRAIEENLRRRQPVRGPLGPALG